MSTWRTNHCSLQSKRQPPPPTKRRRKNQDGGHKKRCTEASTRAIFNNDILHVSHLAMLGKFYRTIEMGTHRNHAMQNLIEIIDIKSNHWGISMRTLRLTSTETNTCVYIPAEQNDFFSRAKLCISSSHKTKQKQTESTI